MMNKCEFIGRLTKDVELKTSSGGKSYCYFTIAATEGFGKYEDTQYPNFVVWDKKAESLARFCGKGNLIYVSAKYQNNSREKDSRGYAIPNPQFSVNEIKFLSGKNSNDNSVDVEAGKIAENKATDDFVPVANISGDELPF